MVTPTFGFSFGDFIAGIKLIIDIYGAFQETDGAKSKYAALVSFLHSLTATLTQLESFMASAPASDEAQGIITLLQSVKGPLKDFADFLDKYKDSLQADSTQSKLGKAKKTISFKIKDITGKVEGLRERVEQPLQTIHLLLSMHTMYVSAASIAEQADNRLSKTIQKLPQNVETVNAKLATDVVTALETLLVQASNEQAKRHDEQFNLQKDVQSHMENLISGLHDGLATSKVAAAAAEFSINDRQQAQLQTLTKLQESILKLSEAHKKSADGLEVALVQLTSMITTLPTIFANQPTGQTCTPQIDDVASQRTSNDENPSSVSIVTSLLAQLATSVLSSLISGAAAAYVTQGAHSRSKIAQQSSTPPIDPDTTLISAADESIPPGSSKRLVQPPANDQVPEPAPLDDLVRSSVGSQFKSGPQIAALEGSHPCSDWNSSCQVDSRIGTHRFGPPMFDFPPDPSGDNDQDAVALMTSLYNPHNIYFGGAYSGPATGTASQFDFHTRQEVRCSYLDEPPSSSGDSDQDAVTLMAAVYDPQDIYARNVHDASDTFSQLNVDMRIRQDDSSNHIDPPSPTGDCDRDAVELMTAIHSSFDTPSEASHIWPSDESTVLACPHCDATLKGSYRKANLVRHIRLKHAHSARGYPCAVESCAKIFNRTDARLKHYRNHHPHLGCLPPARRTFSAAYGDHDAVSTFVGEAEFLPQEQTDWSPAADTLANVDDVRDTSGSIAWRGSEIKLYEIVHMFPDN